jgi:hypothetical protein
MAPMPILESNVYLFLALTDQILSKEGPCGLFLVDEV